MDSKEIRTFEELHQWVQAFGRRVIIYRGVNSLEHKLVPKVGRYNLPGKGNRQAKEETILRLFKDQALPHLDFVPNNDWEWLAIAQHHGLPTRLLDWSRNPLVAAYFAVEQEYDGDSALYAFHNTQLLSEKEHPDPFRIDAVARFAPRHITRRITAQTGLFTVHPNPQEPFESEWISQLIIKRRFRKRLKGMLYKYGIHRASMFPDLDGITGHIQWLRTDWH